MMGKWFHKSKCKICGKMISNCGFANWQHWQMHEREKVKVEKDIKRELIRMEV